MVEISRPWAGIVLGDAGPYSDFDWEEVWATFRGPGYGVPDVNHLLYEPGVFKGQMNELGATIPGNNQITIASGRAMVNGKWYQSDANEIIAVPTEAANDRIDRIVLRKNVGAQTVRLFRIAGVPGIPAAAPALVQVWGVTWDLPLWQVYMALGVALPALWRDERDYVGQYEPVGISDSIVYLDWDFFGVGTYVTATPNGPFENVLGGGGTITNLVEAGFGAGAIEFRMDGAGVGTTAYVESRVHKPDQINARLRVRAKCPNTDAVLDKFIGFGSSLSLTPVNGVYFRCDGVGNWVAVCRAGGVETAQDTGQAADNTWRIFEIRQTGIAVVVFLIDGVVVATHVTNIPNDQIQFLDIGAFDDGVGTPAANPYLHLDYAKLAGDR